MIGHLATLTGSTISIGDTSFEKITNPTPL